MMHAGKLESAMNIPIQYGQASMELRISDGRPVEVVSPKDMPADEGSIVRSLSQPIGLQDLQTFLSGKKKVLVVMNDHTRATPDATVLRALNLRGKNVTTIVATGTHRSPNSQEMRKLLGGAAPPYGGKVVVHDSRDVSTLKPLGQTSRGTYLFLNSYLFDADGIIAIGSVEPHYFAGLTGGRKFLLPALAGFRSVEMNHSLALDERARILALDGNPVHEDFMDALQIFGRNNDIFSIQLVLNAQQQVCFARAGHIVESFREAVERAKEVYTSPVKGKADVIVAVVNSPIDLDLYQAHKAIENVKSALNDGGVLILVARCPDGIGDRGFYDALTSGEDIESKLKLGYRFGYHKALKIQELQEKASIFGVTGLPPKFLEAISIKPFKDVQNAFEAATKLKGKECKVLIINDAGVSVPIPPS